MYPVPGGYAVDDLVRGFSITAYGVEYVHAMHTTADGPAVSTVVPATVSPEADFTGSGPNTLFVDTRGTEPLIGGEGPDVVRLQMPGFGVVRGRAPGGNFDLGLFNGRIIEYIDAVYQAFLGRQPDDAGLEFWYGLLDTGTPRESMVASFLRLPEHADLAVANAYRQILHRDGEPGGVAYWSQFLQAGGSLDDLRALLYGSPEYLAASGGGTTAGFFDALYGSILHRAPDTAGRTYWTGLLDRGVSRVDVARAMLVLAEPVRVAVFDLYLHLFGRTPSAGELDFWQGVWQTRGEFTVVAALAGSGEYYDLVAPTATGI
jgi:hypothetical protein